MRAGDGLRNLCEPFSAHKAARLGIVSGLVPGLKIGGTFVANPTVITDRMLDEYGRWIHGDFKTGAAYKEGLAAIKGARSIFPLLDAAVEELCAKLLETFPECMTKSLEELVKAELRTRGTRTRRTRAHGSPST